MREHIIKEALSQRFGNGADAGQIADAIVAVLRMLHTELALVVGVQASDALVTHAVHRTRTRVDWTTPAAATASDTMFTALHEDLAARPPAVCLFAGETLIFALVDHLISLIGEPLTLRMLNAAWFPPGADQSSQENL